MTVPATTRKAGPFLGNGVQTSFPFAFKVFSEGDVAVTLTDALGLDSLAVLNTDYSVTINPNQESSPGGAITYPLSGAPLAVGARLTVTGDIDYDQPLDLPSGGNFSPLALENQLDRTTFQIQQLREVVGRAVLAPVSSNASGQLPRPAASALIGWDASETTLQNYPLSALATGVAYALQFYQDFTGTGAQTAFALGNDPVTLGNTLVIVDGLVLTPAVDYTLVAGSIVFAVAPALNAEIIVRYGQAVALGGAAADSLDVAHIPATGGATTVRAAIRAIEALGWVTTAKLAPTIAPVVTSINGGQLAGMRNLLINGNLAINQRGYASGAAVGAANTYTLDRWRVVVSGQSLVFSASGNGNQMTPPAGGVEQVIEGANVGGGTYVLNWTGTATATVNGTPRAKSESFTLTAGTNATVRLIGGTASLVQLEPGTTPTPFEHRPIGVELALCQRYYEGGTYSLGGYNTSGNGISVWVAFKVTKRATPSFIPIGTIGSNVGAAAVDSIAIDGARVVYAVTATGSATGAGNWAANIEL